MNGASHITYAGPPAAGATGFAAGTAIHTPEGDILIEHLTPGDRVTLPAGGTAIVTAVSRRQLDLTHPAQAEKLRPVRIQPGALGDGLPARQLTLAPGHALLIDHVLVQVSDLIDKATIFQDHATSAIEYVNIELADAGSLVAEGAAAEAGSGAAGRGIACAPLCGAGPTLAAIRARLAARRRRLGLAAVETHALSARTPGRALSPVLNASREATFAIPAGATELLIGTPTFTAADFDPASSDRRQLGLALTAITTDGQSRPPESLAISGLHRRTGADPHAWTTGALRLKIPENTRRVTLHIAARPKTWRFDPKQAALS